jgi:hypothetical protein
VLGAAFGLFIIALLAASFLMRSLETRSRADANGLSALAENEPETGFLYCAPHCVEVVNDQLSISSLEILNRRKSDVCSTGEFLLRPTQPSTRSSALFRRHHAR